VASLPKSGRTSISQYFNCGGYAASHQFVKINDKSSELSRDCIHRNVLAGRAPLDNCGVHGICILVVVPANGATKRFADVSAAASLHPEIDYYHPSVLGMDALYQHYPNATMVMITRHSTIWYKSIGKFGEGSLNYGNCVI
jgi:hypothetical protein